MARSQGFANQRLCVVPRPLVAAAQERPVTRRLIVTDAGYFPSAGEHVRVRPHGAEEAILLLCAAGTGWIVAGGERVTLTPSTCALIPAGLAHSYGSSDVHPWTIWWCHVRGTDLRDLGEIFGARHELTTVGLRSLDRVTALFDEIVSSLERGQTPAHLLSTSGLAWHLFTQIVVDRILPQTGTPLERAIRYLDERIDSSVRVAELAALVGLSPSHLTATFSKATGGGVTAYHITMKMSRARGLLDATGLSIGEVARAVGYNDPLYFSRQFRKLHGVDPTTYRSQHKG